MSNGNLSERVMAALELPHLTEHKNIGDTFIGYCKGRVARFLARPWRIYSRRRESFRGEINVSHFRHFIEIVYNELLFRV